VLEEEVADLSYGDTAFRRTVSSAIAVVVWTSFLVALGEPHPVTLDAGEAMNARYSSTEGKLAADSSDHVPDRVW
jgi:hypothetical protein